MNTDHKHSFSIKDEASLLQLAYEDLLIFDCECGERLSWNMHEALERCMNYKKSLTSHLEHWTIRRPLDDFILECHRGCCDDVIVTEEELIKRVLYYE